jgi:hypothetical protein
VLFRGAKLVSEELMDEPHACTAAQKLAARIVSGDDHRSLAAQKLLTGMLSYWLHVALHGQLRAEFMAMADELANPKLAVDQLWQQMDARCLAVAEAVSYMRSLPAAERANVERTAYCASVAALERLLSNTVAGSTAATMPARHSL